MTGYARFGRAAACQAALRVTRRTFTVRPPGDSSRTRKGLVGGWCLEGSPRMGWGADDRQPVWQAGRRQRPGTASKQLEAARSHVCTVARPPGIAVPIGVHVVHSASGSTARTVSTGNAGSTTRAGSGRTIRLDVKSCCGATLPLNLSRSSHSRGAVPVAVGRLGWSARAVTAAPVLQPADAETNNGCMGKQCSAERGFGPGDGPSRAVSPGRSRSFRVPRSTSTPSMARHGQPLRPPGTPTPTPMRDAVVEGVVARRLS
jgi:hypothetical protein